MYLSTGSYKAGNIRAITLNQSLPSRLLPSKELIESLCILQEYLLAALNLNRMNIRWVSSDAYLETE
jgi:hypothetical protein